MKVGLIFFLSIQLGILLLQPGCAYSLLPAPPAAALNDASDEEILQATVTIRIQASAPDADGNPIYLEANGRQTPLNLISGGLGTIVNYGHHQYIITHDHYAQLDAPVATVTITESSGTQIVLGIKEFHERIRYRNNGVVIFDAPPQIPGGAAFVNAETIQPDSLVQVVYRSKQTDDAVIIPAIVESRVDFQGIPCFRIRNLNGEVIEKGNSGGGVWYQGRLIGVIHRTITTPETCTAPATVESPGQPTHCGLATRLSPHLWQSSIDKPELPFD
jgi:hypothetical protein